MALAASGGAAQEISRRDNTKREQQRIMDFIRWIVMEFRSHGGRAGPILMVAFIADWAVSPLNVRGQVAPVE